jgi:hypothetical protein
VAADNAYRNGTANPTVGVTYNNRKCNGVQVCIVGCCGGACLVQLSVFERLLHALLYNNRKCNGVQVTFALHTTDRHTEAVVLMLLEASWAELGACYPPCVRLKLLLKAGITEHIRVPDPPDINNITLHYITCSTQKKSGNPNQEPTKGS